MIESEADIRERVASSAKELGVVVLANELDIEWREWRWFADLPGGLVAFYGDSQDAALGLERERAVLDMLNDRVSFETPTVELTSDDHRLQIRRKVPGDQIGGGPEPEIGRSSIARPLARSLGAAYGELHCAVTLGECEALGIRRGGWLFSADELEERLSHCPLEDRVVEALSAVLAIYRRLVVPRDDLVFTHGDPWGGNLAVDLDTGSLNGLFDFDEMAIDDRHMELRYLFSFGVDFRDWALAAYEEASGVVPDIKRTNLYHIFSAFDALARDLPNHDETRIARRQRWVDASIERLMADLPYS